MNGPPAVAALLFDVFGTVVDWRSSIIREGRALATRLGLSGVDWAAFADAWRARYQPSMEAVRTGARPWVPLDVLHRESLDLVLADHGLTGIAADAVDDFNLAWHRLEPWPDVVAGLGRLRTRFTLATCSNGNTALLTEMAERAGLQWDAILGAEPTRHYKPQPEVYLGSTRLLAVSPDRCMMVAAHNSDLAAAAAAGLRTAFVARPTEHGPGQSWDLVPGDGVDVAAADLIDLADTLGC